MFFFSKIISALTEPFTIVFLLLAATPPLLFTRHWRTGRLISACVLAACVLTSALPLSDWLLVPLENRFSVPEPMPESVDGIVVLGGLIDPEISEARGQTSLGGSSERVTTLVTLAARYPEAKLVFTGGAASLWNPHLREAHYARTFLASVGFDVSRVLFEDQSRNTRENATLSRALVPPIQGQRWLLVTSAMHMPRAMGVFRADGWSVIPYPVDYQTTGESNGWFPTIDFSAGLRVLHEVRREWLGLAYYRLRGWTDALFPGPERGL